MHIIFGNSIELIPDSFTVLELDTFLTEQGPVTAHCVIEKVPLEEFPLLDANKKLHSDLMRYYREQQWDYCDQVISQLQGRWATELDSFYHELGQRIKHYKDNPPGENWNGYIDKTGTKSTSVPA